MSGNSTDSPRRGRQRFYTRRSQSHRRLRQFVSEKNEDRHLKSRRLVSLITPLSKSISHKSISGVVGALALCAALSVHADLVDDYVRKELARQRIPGLAVVVTQSGKIVKVAGYGYANLEHQVPVKPETVFQSGSISKQLAATVAMLLVEDGKIVLDEPVKKYLPDTPRAWDNITVRHLLTHTSGIPEYEFGKDFEMRKDYTDDERLRIVYEMKLEFSPGSRWNYSDTGYMVLGILLSRAGGEFYGDILRRRVFEPLGMKTARIISEEDVVPNRASGYRLVKGEIKNQKFVSPSNYKTADGSLSWSVLDLAKWADAGRTKALLKSGSWREMTTAVRLTSGKTYPYGFVWFIDEWGGKEVLGHGGFGSGFTAQLSRRLGDDELAVGILCNRVGIRLGKIARDIMAIYEPELALIEKPIEDSEPGTTAQVRSSSPVLRQVSWCSRISPFWKADLTKSECMTLQGLWHLSGN